MHGKIVAEYIDPSTGENWLVVDSGGNDNTFEIPEEHYLVLVQVGCCLMRGSIPEDASGALPQH